MAEVFTARLTKELVQDLSLVAKTEYLDKSAVLRRLLVDAIANWKKKRALTLYTDGKYSLEQAARFAKLSLWEFYDLLKREKIPLTYDKEELQRDLRNIQW